jgi:acyl carrier protein
MTSVRGYGGQIDGLTPDSVRAVVGKIVEKMGQGAPSQVSDESRLAEDLGFDSLRLIELTIVIEQAFGLPALDMESACAVRTVRDVTDLVLGLQPGDRS